MPYPRLRIYTNFNSYFSFFKDLILGRINKGNDIEILEKALADKFNVSYAACLPMNRVGIYLVLKNLIRPDQEVIMSPYTISDVVNMVICAKGVPVFADIEEDSCNINPNEVERLITDKTGAVLITHLHGVNAKAHEILRICRAHNLPMIEDAAQAVGGFENGKRLGTIGEAGIYSFGMYKNINCWYGGAVVSENKILIDKIKSDLRQRDYMGAKFIFKRMLKGLMTDFVTHPLIFKLLTYRIFRYGFLYNISWINRKIEIELDLSRKDVMPPHYLKKMTPFQARLVLSQFSQIDSDIEIRNKKAMIYREGLTNISDLGLAPKENNSVYIYPVFPIQYGNTKDLLKYLMLNNRDATHQHLKNCADLPSFSAYYRDCPIARRVANNVINLPIYTRYPDSEIRENIRVIRKYFKLVS